MVLYSYSLTNKHTLTHKHTHTLISEIRSHWFSSPPHALISRPAPDQLVINQSLNQFDIKHCSTDWSDQLWISTLQSERRMKMELHHPPVTHVSEAAQRPAPAGNSDTHLRSITCTRIRGRWADGNGTLCMKLEMCLQTDRSQSNNQYNQFSSEEQVPPSLSTSCFTRKDQILQKTKNTFLKL